MWRKPVFIVENDADNARAINPEKRVDDCTWRRWPVRAAGSEASDFSREPWRAKAGLFSYLWVDNYLNIGNYAFEGVNPNASCGSIDGA
ncbi:hypothetical protein C4J98_3364 [Pseudomonas orientalis]|nr:hypothetical protein C4J98_3364 [Pseudomonas orientalis]